MPSVATIFNWFRTQEGFLNQYKAAKEEQADAMAEEMLDIADDGTNDWMEVRDSEGATIGYKVNGEHVQRSRLRIDTRKWLASKLKPKKYSEKLDMAVTGTIGVYDAVPIPVAERDPLDAAAGTAERSDT